MTSYNFSGIYAATLCPMHEDGRIDLAGLDAHLGDMASVEGLSGLLVNGHAGENFTLEQAEKRTVITCARDALDDHRQLVAGINAEASDEACRQAEQAANAGADALLVFPPFSWSLCCVPEMIIEHHRRIQAATSLPLFLYQAPVNAGQLAYPPTVLEVLVQLPSVIAIKEGSWETATYEANRRRVKALRPEIAVMASGDEHLLGCFILGSEGSLVSLAALVPNAIIALERAVASGDLRLARCWHERLYPLASAIYTAAPPALATVRLKACLQMMDRINSPNCRAPLPALSEAERLRLREALIVAGALEQ